MSIEPIDASSSDRERTNQSLRAERRDIDGLVRELANIDATADAAITRARERSDAGLAAARASADRLLKGDDSTPGTAGILEQTRSLEDRALRNERLEEDTVLDDARAEKLNRLTSEREATDRGLSHERAQSDEVLKTRDEVLSVVGHDLRNMLMTILGMAELIEEDADPAGGPHSTLAYIRFIRQAGARMTRLVGDLSDMASIEAGTLAVTCERGDVGAIVNEALEMFRLSASDRGIALTANIDPSLPSAVFDGARIYQVIANLLSNAIKFTPEKGSVTVSVKRDSDDICFAVADTGVGIPTDQLTAVFGRHVQLSKDDRRGAGIGLYISRSIVRRHGGRIWVESKPGAGSTFFFTLPMSVSVLP